MSQYDRVAYEVYGLIEELSALSRLDKLRGAQLGRAYELMGLLRDSGFTPGEISRFTWNPVSGKLKWGKATVRKCGKWSGVADMSRRDSVVDFISGLVESGVKLEEVVEFKVAKPKLDRVGLSFSDSAKIGEAVFSSRANVTDLAAFSVEVKACGLMLPELVERMKLVGEIEGVGLTKEKQEAILAWATSFGGKDALRRFMETYPGIDSMIKNDKDMTVKTRDLKLEVKGLEDDVEVLREVKENYMEFLREYQIGLDIVNVLIDNGWTVPMINTLSAIIKIKGEPLEVITYVLSCCSKKKLEAAVAKVANPEPF